MLRRTWKPLTVTVFGIGAPSYLYYTYTRPKKQTFDLPVRERGPDGIRTMTTQTIPLLSMDEVNSRLSENAISKTTRRPGGIVWNRTTASLSSNDPIEDANASAIVERDPNDPSAGDLLFFAVMDGHAGPHTSRLLSKILLPAVATELSSLIQEPQMILGKPGFLQNLKSKLWSTVRASSPLDADPNYFSLAIQSAFTRLDSELTNAPLRLLASELEKAGLDPAKIDKSNIPDLSEHPMALQTIQPALSGSCALLAVLDTAHRNLYVACTGDCRAVAGVWEETPSGGAWKVEVLSEDQTGRNPNEIARLKSEHPPDEADFVIRNGRVLGGLEPTRAFGDNRYKWSKDVQDFLSAAFMGGNMRAWPGLLKTPPYVTSKPVVSHRKIYSLPSTSPEQPAKSAIRFLILATDGLWDQISSEDAVALVGGHLAGLKGSIPKSKLSELIPTTSGSPTIEGKNKSRGTMEGTWAFIDDNLSTHLIRNAFGGADTIRLRKLLSIPAPFSRNHRDDVTVTVVWWEDGRESEKNTTTFTAPKAKL